MQLWADDWGDLVMSSRLKVEEIKPGMFSTEFYVRFSGVGGSDHALFVDKSSVQNEDGTMEVQVIYINSDQALVELPRDTTGGYGRVQVPVSALLAM